MFLSIRIVQLTNNKQYVDINIADKASKSYVDSEIAKIPQQPQNVLLLDGSKAMTGDLDMGGKEIVNIKPFVEDDDIQPQQDNHAITFGYFHTERGELKRLINETGYEALNRKNPDPMEDDIDMANHKIVNLKDPENDNDAVNKKFMEMNTSFSHDNYINILPIYKNNIIPQSIDTFEHINIKVVKIKTDSIITEQRRHLLINFDLLIDRKTIYKYQILKNEFFNILIIHNIGRKFAINPNNFELTINNLSSLANDLIVSNSFSSYDSQPYIPSLIISIIKINTFSFFCKFNK